LPRIRTRLRNSRPASKKPLAQSWVQ